MLQVIREFAIAKLHTRNDAESVRRRHAEYVMDFAERAGPQLVSFELRDWNRRLRRDEENLRAALRWAIEAGEPEIGLRTASAIWRYWHYWGVLGEGRDWVQKLLEHPAASARTATRAKGLSALASLVYWLGDMTRADALYSDAMAIYSELGDEAGVTEMTESMLWTDVGQGNYEGAISRVQTAIERYRAAGDRAGVARMDTWLKAGGFFMGMGVSAEQALASTREGVEAAREQGNAWDMVNYQGEIADIYRRMGDVPRAIREFQTTTEIFYGLGAVGSLPYLKLMARLELMRDRPERAATLAAIAQRAVDDVGGELPEELTQVGNPLEDARRLLSEEAFARAVTEGIAMSFDEAVAYTLES
jgi:non-specific serine/threonine protein kinase